MRRFPLVRVLIVALLLAFVPQIASGGWRTLRRGTGVNPCTTETRGGAESFLRFMRKRFGF
jgi:hypothetical protein